MKKQVNRSATIKTPARTWVLVSACETEDEIVICETKPQKIKKSEQLKEAIEKIAAENKLIFTVNVGTNETKIASHMEKQLVALLTNNGYKIKAIHQIKINQ